MFKVKEVIRVRCRLGGMTCGLPGHDYFYIVILYCNKDFMKWFICSNCACMHV